MCDKKLDSTSFINSELKPLRSVSDEIIRKRHKQFNCQLEAFIKLELHNLGYDFWNHNEFYDFIKERLRRVTYKNGAETINDFFLDYIDENNQGIFIHGYSETNKQEINATSMSMSIELKMRTKE